MGGGKGGTTAAPDYTSISASNEAAARIAQETSREQLAWAKETYAADAAVTKKFLDVALPMMEAEAAAGKDSRERYETVFQPIEDELVAEAKDYNSVTRQNLEAGKATADVTMAFESQRRGALATLEGYGIDPSTARSGALDRSVRVAEAAATAGAANAARTQTENIGRALRGEALNIGKGYPGQIASAYQTAQNSGGGAVNANLATTASGSNTMGSPIQWSQQQQGFMSNWNQNLAGQGAVYAADQKAAAASSAGIGALAGGVLGLGASMMMPGSGGASSMIGRLAGWTDKPAR